MLHLNSWMAPCCLCAAINEQMTTKLPKESLILGKIGRGGISASNFMLPSQKMENWQQDLLSQRSAIESAFDYLKEHLHLVTSFPRSVYGYLAHYAMVLLGYQVLKLANLI